MADDGLSDGERAALNDLQATADDLGNPLLLIGASARQLVFDRPLHLTLHRATDDWDAAIRVHDGDAYHRLIATLAQVGFRRTATAHRLTHRGIINLDLVPYGPLAAPDDRLVWPTTERSP